MKPALPWFLQPSSRDFNTGCVVLFTLPFLIVGFLGLQHMTWYPVRDWLGARHWEATDAVIEKAWLDKSEGCDGDSRKVTVKYRYSYHGSQHVGTRLTFDSASIDIGVRSMEETVQMLPQEKRVTCWVNPADPSEAVLDRSLSIQALIGLFFATPFIIIGLVGLGFLALPWLRRRFAAGRQAELQELVDQGRLPAWVMQPFANDPAARANDVALVIAADERLPQALGVTLLGLFWNSIVAVGVYVAVMSFGDGESGTGWLLSLFLIPFAAVGIGICWTTVKRWRLTRRHRWVAALRPAPDFAGGPVTFCWAWLDARRLLRAPEAAVRLVAQAAYWNEESDSPTRVVGRKRRTKVTDAAASRKTELELAAVEVPLVDDAKEIHLTLPCIPTPSPGRVRKWLPRAVWGGWWQLEVTYGDGEIEPADLTKAEKLGDPGSNQRN